MLLTANHLNRLVSQAKFYMLVGFVALVAEYVAGIGLLSAFSFFTLGASLSCVED